MTAIKQSASHGHGRKRTDVGLDSVGINPSANVYWNLNTPELYEIIAQRNEGKLSAHGALIVDTGEHTGRAYSRAAALAIIVAVPSAFASGLVDYVDATYSAPAGSA